jgi:hypothetical protein
MGDPRKQLFRFIIFHNVIFKIAKFYAFALTNSLSLRAGIRNTKRAATEGVAAHHKKFRATLRLAKKSR